ncbi:hypothetical protein ABS772_00315 [Methylorubrum podarium]|uniref:SAM-dependent methyltransferase n=1 Tax=Methylorubrum podarium TaxID=200476 RepID=A0ABV1QG53_9HYPH
MAERLEATVARSAAKLVELGAGRGTSVALDYSQASLTTLEEMAEEAACWAATLTPGQIDGLVQQAGCYLLEVGRREFGGEYRWHEERDQPVLVVGEPDFHVALMTWDKVRSRLAGDRADDLRFFYDGFAERVRQAGPGTRALYV